MTIAKTGSSISNAGNGSLTPFSFPYRFLESTDLNVFLIVDSTGVSTLQTITTHYTLSNTGTEDGGTVTMVTAPASGETLLIQRSTPVTQGTDYAANDAFPAETHEAALDRLTLISQESSGADSLKITLPDGDLASPDLPALASRADKLFGFDSSGEIEMLPNTQSGVSFASQAQADAGVVTDKSMSPSLVANIPGALVLLADTTASATAAVEFTAFDDATRYNRYEIHIDDLISATDGDQLRLRISLDDGSTWKSTASSYHWREPGGSIQTANHIEIGDTQADGSGDTGGFITIEALLPAAAHSMFFSRSTGHSTLDVLQVSNRAGSGILNTGQVNGLQFYMSTGNITSGRFRLFGRNI